jgi:hypothetical protein
MVDGQDVLMRVAVSILRLAEDQLLKCNSAAAFYTCLESTPSRMWEPTKLLKVQLLHFPSHICRLMCFQLESDLRATMTHEDIVKKREHHLKATED